MTDIKVNYERHIVLVRPEIHWNTGNIGRTCLGAGASLHLIKPLGFSLQNNHVKRAGLDYWEKVKLFVWENFEEFKNIMKPDKKEVFLFAKKGKKTFWSMECPNRAFLIFGSETKGLPHVITSLYPDSIYHIPISSQVRCLNLSTAAGIALYESLRKARPFHAWS